MGTSAATASPTDAGSVRRAVGIAVVLIQFMHVSCKQLIGITPAGHVDRAVTFTLHDADGRPLEARISDFVVYELTAGNPPAVVWELGGSQPVKVIAYGQAPPGLTVRQPPKDLTRGSNYRAVVVGDRSTDYGGATFTIDANGTVVTTSPPARGPRPSDRDMNWFGRHRQKAVDALMPVDDPSAKAMYRSHRDLYYDEHERYFSIGWAKTVEAGAKEHDLQATVVAPIGRSIQSQVLDLHMKDRAASFESVLSRVSIRRTSVSGRACPAVQERLDSLTGLGVQVRQPDTIVLHPVIHRIVLLAGTGRIDAELDDDREPLVRWALETHEALLKCAR